ncbi:Reverse transcriptase (RNA-dependent DNA polymerase) [Popillia japonica]|uniref:Reverse transcriptase (RNA-dependent DNA polymerase) n=1 Tax=Popillia japonica TaxID=7064 RepID=A0AAW1IT96_POPJA
MGTKIRSSLTNTLLGVPQESVLGRILFSLYTNDLPNCIGNIVMYADGISIIIADTDSNLQATTSHTLEQLHEWWFTSNGLFLNARKTNFLIFHPKQKIIEPQYDLSINNTDLQHPESVKFLGSNIDENLSWAEACTNIASKLNRSCYLFRSLRDLLDFDTLKIVYFSEIESRLRYGILLWGTSGSRSNQD